MLASSHRCHGCFVQLPALVEMERLHRDAGIVLVSPGSKSLWIDRMAGEAILGQNHVTSIDGRGETRRVVEKWVVCKRTCRREVDASENASLQYFGRFSAVFRPLSSF